jgi:hypothetical protein
MKMRHYLFAAGLALALAAPAGAFENFIPLGTGYSTEVGSLPPFDSYEGQIAQQTDIYESEIYGKQRRAKEFESRLRQFSSENDYTGAGAYIDY